MNTSKSVYGPSHQWEHARAHTHTHSHTPHTAALCGFAPAVVKRYLDAAWSSGHRAIAGTLRLEPG